MKKEKSLMMTLIVLLLNNFAFGCAQKIPEPQTVPKVPYHEGCWVNMPMGTLDCQQTNGDMIYVPLGSIDKYNCRTPEDFNLDKSYMIEANALLKKSWKRQ